MENTVVSYNRNHYTHGIMQKNIARAAEQIGKATYLSAFTGAGISVESGIPPFRGKNGLWNRYDPALFEIEYYMSYPEESWPLMVKLFYEIFEHATPNRAHEVLAALEREERLKALITQNIDNLHYRAGSRNIVEYHGNPRELVCTACGKTCPVTPEILTPKVPYCTCSGLLKPAFVFFGEGIPPKAARDSERIARKTDVMLVIGTTGSVYPAALIPRDAKMHGAVIIEMNPEASEYTSYVTDIFIKGQAGKIMDDIYNRL